MFKRSFDVTVASLGLIALAPLMAAIAAMVRVTTGSPILFRQERAGLKGRPFWILKFRTMIDSRGSDGELLPDELRITRFGNWLRASSMDELPTLWSVVRGDMSLVGPRPLLMRYLDRYSAEQARRHDVRPGITGWAQVQGRNAISWEEKFALDVQYVERRSVVLDLEILARTAVQVFAWKNTRHPGSATMPEFMGSAASNTDVPSLPG